MLWWFLAGLTVTGLVVWCYLLLARGRYWMVTPHVPAGAPPPEAWPSLAVIVPARDEAAVLPDTLPSLLAQGYAGAWRIYVVDDGSTDGTAGVVRRTVQESPHAVGEVVAARPKPGGWTGKVWALHEGVAAADAAAPDFLAFVDADIRAGPGVIADLVAFALTRQLDLVSVMARLRAETAWDRLLVPAFVYFFAMLYPFTWSNDRARRTAAAAGGCVLLRREALARAGGIEGIAGAIIDDCALAALLKRAGHATWLGFDGRVESVRSYGRPRAVGGMVARSAYAQLRYSRLALAATVGGMVGVFAWPPLAAVVGCLQLAAGGGAAGAIMLAAGGVAWGLMAVSYLPQVRWHGVWPGWALALPLAAIIYTLATLESARSHWAGGVAWKGRRYGAPPA